MKAQRRHDLQANSLADNLVEIVEYLKQQSQAILVAVAAVVVILVGIWYWQYSTAMRRAQGWQNLENLVSSNVQQDPQYIDKLEQVAASSRDQGLRAMAYAQLGNELLGQATFGGQPADKAADLRQRAQAAFAEALKNAGGHAKTAAIAHLGLAAIAADTGDAGMARQYLEAVRDDANLKGTPYPSQATAQLDALDAAAKLAPLATNAPATAGKVAPATRPS